MRLVRPLLFSLTFLASTVITQNADTNEHVSPVKHNYQASFTVKNLEHTTKLSLFYVERRGASA